MDLRNIPIFGAISRRMAGLNERQQVLAQNIANSDTPGYKRLEVSFEGNLRKAIDSKAALKDVDRSLPTQERIKQGLKGVAK